MYFFRSSLLEPLITYIEQDLATGKVDLLAVHRYLSHKLLSLTPQPFNGPSENIPTSAVRPLNPMRPDVPGEESVWAKLHEMFSDNSHQIDAAEIDAKFHANGMLQVPVGPFKNDVTAKMTISTPPSLLCHRENNRICNLKQSETLEVTVFVDLPLSLPSLVTSFLNGPLYTFCFLGKTFEYLHCLKSFLDF